MIHPTVVVTFAGTAYTVAFGPRTLGRIEEALSKTTFELATWIVGNVPALPKFATPVQRAAWEAKVGEEGVRQFKAGEALKFVQACVPATEKDEPSNKDLAEAFRVLVGGFMQAVNELFGPDEDELAQQGETEEENPEKKTVASGSGNFEPGPSSSLASDQTSSTGSHSPTSGVPAKHGKRERKDKTSASAS